MANTESSNDAIYSDGEHELTYDEILDNPFDLQPVNPGGTVFLNKKSPVEVLANLIFYRKSNCYLVLGGSNLWPGHLKTTDSPLTGLMVGLETSGTSGVPKLVTKNLKLLLEQVEKKQSRSRIKHRWGLLFDHEKMAGLQVMLHAFTRQESLFCPQYQESTESKIEQFAQNSVSALSATPSMWRHLLNFPGIKTLNLEQITLGGEKSDFETLDRLTRVFPNSRITQIYATTELGEIFTVRDGKPGFPADYLNQSFGNRTLRVDENLNLIVNEAGIEYNTNDIVNVAGQRVYFMGRSDALINVGGEKIDPSKIENALLSHPSVADAYVAGLANPRIGNLVCANVILHPNQFFEEEKLKRFLLTKLNRAEMPAIIVEVEEFSLNSNGKRRLAI